MLMLGYACRSECRALAGFDQSNHLQWPTCKKVLVTDHDRATCDVSTLKVFSPSVTITT